MIHFFWPERHKPAVSVPGLFRTAVPETPVVYCRVQGCGSEHIEQDGGLTKRRSPREVLSALPSLKGLRKSTSQLFSPQNEKVNTTWCLPHCGCCSCEYRVGSYGHPAERTIKSQGMREVACTGVHRDAQV